MFQQEMENLSLGVAPELVFTTEDLLNTSVSLLQQEYGYENPLDDLEGMDCDLTSTGKPSDITGQCLATKMKDDKEQVLQEIQMMNSDVRTGIWTDMEETKMDLTQGVQVWTTTTTETTTPTPTVVVKGEKKDSAVETQEFIDQLDQFLKQYDDGGSSNNTALAPAPVQAPAPVFAPLESDTNPIGLLNEAQQLSLKSMDTSCPVSNNTLTDEETAAAEELLDTLLKGTLDDSVDSGYASTSNNTTLNGSMMTEVKADDGSDVIIVVTPEDGLETSGAGQLVTIEDYYPHHQRTATETTTKSTLAVPSIKEETMSTTSSVYGEEVTTDDSEWAPDSPRSVASSVTSERKKPGRKPAARKSTRDGRVYKKSYTIQDKKERKRQQNVEAARKYRDKKNGEKKAIETEEQKLSAKNKALKSQMSELQSELKTLKKLMLELGLVKWQK